MAVGARSRQTTVTLAAAIALAAGCSGGTHEPAPPVTTTTAATSTTTATTVPATTTTTTLPHLSGQAVTVGGRRYTLSLTGPALTTQIGSRSVPPGEGIVTFVLTVGNPTAEPLAVTPLDSKGSPTDIHLLGPAGDSDFTCSSPAPFPGHCDITGVQVEDDSATDTGPGTIAPGHLDTIVYEDSTVVPSSVKLSSLSIVLVDGGPAPGYVTIMSRR